MNKLVIIAGPTASGKSALAVGAAVALGGVAINADSMQVYQGVPILTAQPSDEDRARAPHRLYGLLPPDELCSAGRWRALAMEECERAWLAGLVPILVGGTGLYLRSLLDGLSPIPDIPDPVRAAARALFTELGNDSFHRLLAEHDPVMAGRLAPGNSQRLMRAWEVLAATGRSLADWQDEPREGGIAADRVTILLSPPRADLYQSCDRRLERMLEQGALAEVDALLARRLDPSLPVMKALGVAEFSAFLHGKCDLRTALQAAQQATRRYAKRQQTWFRHQIIAEISVDKKFSESLMSEIISFIRRFLLTAAN